MPLLIALAASILLNGCNPQSTQEVKVETTAMGTTAPTTQSTTEAKTAQATKATTEIKHCKQYDAAVRYIEEYKKTLAAQYGEQYLDSEESKTFIASFWKSFWEAHKDCKICPEVNK